MRRTLPVTLVVLLLMSLAEPVFGEPSPALTRAVARAAETHTLQTSASLGHPVRIDHGALAASPPPGARCSPGSSWAR
jgi:hypothetical protein